MEKPKFWQRNDLSLLFLLSIFMNGFETGGYQAALLYIGQEFDLSIGQQGILASVQLVATMIAPLLLGPLADRIGKQIMLVVFTASRVLSAAVILLATDSVVFAIGIFTLGFACSIVQYVAIAGMQDAYPLTRNRRMGYITAMFALGAVVAPLIVGISVGMPGGWRSFFLLSGLIFLLLTVFLARTDFSPREELAAEEVQSSSDRLYLKGMALLCTIMFIYVGVENGVCFFLSNFMLATMDSARGYLALSLFWLAMIPSRFLCGIFAKYRDKLIYIAPLGAALLLAILTLLTSELAAFAVVFALGFFCGGVYPNVLTYVADFAGGRTATVTAAITVATGVGAAIVSASFGFLHASFGFTGAFLILAILLGIDVVVALLVPRLRR
ncbi:Fucose permease [Selenomonas sp. GACV-9]|uniref:MFS transporter n=1 Tax=Selenomonas sp. GACV-9 TaxID=3158782 RepID=UPI0008EA73BD|nr:Fucose permease [Selenomonas ruminantium]